MNQPDLGKKIAELRKAKGYTQEELVEKCNLSVRTLQRIESGEVTPRSYTLKIIFAALDYNFYDSSEITLSKFSKTEFVINQWLGQFYRYVIDLFNLKTNKMKKISILSIVFFAIIFGFLSVNTNLSAQKKDTQFQENKEVEDSVVRELAFTDFSCHGCMEQKGLMIGRDVSFKLSGVKVTDIRLMTLDKKTREFHALFVKGKFLERKVEVEYPKDMLIDGKLKYFADKVEKSGDKIMLKGNAKLTSAQNETIEAEEIIITTI